jgi:hypothetical protein
MKQQQASKRGPLFVVGMNGSGTTMLADCLDNSAELYVFPRETRVIPWLINHIQEFGDLTVAENRLKLLHTFCQYDSLASVDSNMGLTDADIKEPSLFGVIDAVYGHLAAKEGKARWVEKSPMNLQSMLPIAQAMPTAQFIHIYRDGRDVAQSNERRWNKNPLWTMYRWVQIVRQGREDGKQLGPERYLEVEYEAFTDRPEAWLQTLCAFIGIEYHAELMRSSMPFVNSLYRKDRYEKSGSIVPNSQKWKKHFSPAQVAQLEEIGGKLLTELGYETTNKTGEKALPAWQLRWWRFVNVFNQGLVYLQRYGFKRNTPKKMLRQFSEGLKQMSVMRH